MQTCPNTENSRVNRGSLAQCPLKGEGLKLCLIITCKNRSQKKGGERGKERMTWLIIQESHL